MIRFYRTNGQNDAVWRYAMEIDGEVIARPGSRRRSTPKT